MLIASFFLPRFEYLMMRRQGFRKYFIKQSVLSLLSNEGLISRAPFFSEPSDRAASGIFIKAVAYAWVDTFIRKGSNELKGTRV